MGVPWGGYQRKKKKEMEKQKPVFNPHVKNSKAQKKKKKKKKECFGGVVYGKKRKICNSNQMIHSQESVLTLFFFLKRQIYMYTF